MSTSDSRDPANQADEPTETSVSEATPNPTTGPAPVHVNVTAAGTDVAPRAVPDGVFLTSVGKKFGVYLLDGLLMAVTLGIGWLIWGAVTAANGQTPARKMLGVYLVSSRDGRPLSWPQMVFMRGIVGVFVMSLAWTVTIGILAFMPLWDRKNQTVNDKVSGAVAVDDPDGVYA